MLASSLLIGAGPALAGPEVVRVRVPAKDVTRYFPPGTGLRVLSPREFESRVEAATRAPAGIRAQAVAPDGSIPNAPAAFSTDAVASIVGPCLGTSVVTAFIESVTGVQAGGRTGLTALTVAAGFVLALFLWPVFVIVPSM